ncbi:MAG TPA: outer membrane beta-barrel protein [Candidatus Kapabacteria bacterium]|jgi:hypothetical protein
MKKWLTASFLVACFFAASFVPSVSRAQFTNGSLYLGPQLGLGIGYGGGATVGGTIEGAVTNPGTVGSGRLAFAGRIDYWGWNNGYYSYSFIPLSVHCNYHFVVSDPRWDLFAGLGLGYAIVSFSYDGPGSSSTSYGGAFFTIGGGTRYFVSTNVAIRGEIALFSYLPFILGVDFRI